MKRTLLSLSLLTAALSACGTTGPTSAPDSVTTLRADKANQSALQPLIVGGTVSARGARPY